MFSADVSCLIVGKTIEMLISGLRASSNRGQSSAKLVYSLSSSAHCSLMVTFQHLLALTVPYPKTFHYAVSCFLWNIAVKHQVCLMQNVTYTNNRSKIFSLKFWIITLTSYGNTLADNILAVKNYILVQYFVLVSDALCSA